MRAYLLTPACDVALGMQALRRQGTSGWQKLGCEQQTRLVPQLMRMKITWYYIYAILHLWLVFLVQRANERGTVLTSFRGAGRRQPDGADPGVEGL